MIVFAQRNDKAAKADNAILSILDLVELTGNVNSPFR